ncbi:hypothetical protein [Streptomyces sp. MBT65]|uniref:hypothetical protein n=1 Tax=Streptomyces sp. MBT65 TaxID=1488395 RepID=UPI001F2379DA|nr:hypothetical protein [Streptomyces sp. MBT65]
MLIDWDREHRIEMPLSAWIRGSVSPVARPSGPSLLRLTMVLNPRRSGDPSIADAEHLQVSLVFNQNQGTELDAFLRAMREREDPDRPPSPPDLGHEPLVDTASAPAPPAEPPRSEVAVGHTEAPEAPEAVGNGDERAASQSAPPAVFIQPLAFVAVPDNDEWTSFRPLPATESLINFMTAPATDSGNVPL